MANPLGRNDFAGAYDPRLVADYIARSAAARGIDPSVALRVARSEGLNAYVGDEGSSFGPFQLHYGNVAAGGNRVGGLGDVFTRQTGLDARDPRTWQAQVDFSLDQAAKSGWGPWHGWKGEQWAGIGGDHPRSATPLYETDRFVPQNGPLMAERPLPPEMLAGRPLAYTAAPEQPFFPSLKAPQPQVAQAQGNVDFSPEDFFEEKHLQPAMQQPAAQAPIATQAPIQTQPYSYEDVFEGKPAPQEAPAAQQQPENVAAVPEAEWGVGKEFLRGALSGLTGGAGDLTRAGATVEALAGGPSDFFARRQDIIARQEAARKQYELESPGLSAIATGLGAGVGTLAPMGVAAKALGMGGRLAARVAPQIAPALSRVGAFVGGEGGLASKAAQGAAYGAGETALSQQLVPEEDRGLQSILYGAGTGGLVGAGTSALLGPIAKSFTAHVPEHLKTLARDANSKFGLDVHVAQVAQDEKVRNLYKALMPNERQTAQIQKWNTKLSEKIGLKGEPLTAENIEKGMRDYGDKISNAVRGTTVKVDPTFQNELYRIHADILSRTPPGDPARAAMTNFYNDIMSAVGPTGHMKGEVLQNFIRHQGRIDRTFGANAADPLMRNVGHDVREAFIDAFTRSNPSVSQQFKKARETYKSLAAVNDIVRGRDIGAVDPKALLEKVRQRKITGDVKELARIGRYLPEMAPSGAAKTGGSAKFNRMHFAELATAAAQPLASVFGLDNPYFTIMSAGAAADLARRGIQSGLFQSNVLNRLALQNQFPAMSAARTMGNVLTGTAAGLGGGVGTETQR